MIEYGEWDGELSNCCGAVIIMGDICGDCREHCEPMEEDDENTIERN
jgi:hypothetical protein